MILDFYAGGASSLIVFSIYVLLLCSRFTVAVPPSSSRPYFEYPSLESFETNAMDLNGPFANAASANKILGIPDAVYNQKLKCSPSIISISHQVSLAGDYLRPQVYISGEIHGNEKVVSIYIYNSLSGE